MIVFGPAPQPPDPIWLLKFESEALALLPGLWPVTARRWAHLAHASTYLLDPEEAAMWWLAVVRHAARPTGVDGPERID